MTKTKKLNLRKYSWISNVPSAVGLSSCSGGKHTYIASEKMQMNHNGRQILLLPARRWLLGSLQHGLNQQQLQQSHKFSQPPCLLIYILDYTTPQQHITSSWCMICSDCSAVHLPELGVGSRGAVWTSFFLTDTTARLLGNNRVSHQENRYRSR